MAKEQKYAKLPDLDQSAEIYETTADADEKAEQADSISSIVSSSEDSDEDSSGIQRGSLDPNSARSHFGSSRVDASRANFSDQVGRHRKSYYVSKQSRDDEESEDDDPEQRLKRRNLSRRIGRMQQLLENLKNDIESAKEQGEWVDVSQEDEDRQDEQTLIEISDSLTQMTITDRGADSATVRMKRRASMKRAAGPTKLRTEQPNQQTSDGNTAQNYAQIADSQALAVYSKFSSRLDTLESLLGVDTIPPPDLVSTKDFPLPLLKMTDVMARQLNLLNEVEDSYLDQLGKRIRTINADADRMDEKRKEARKGYADLMDAREASLNGYGSSNGYPITPRSPTLSGTTRRAGGEDDRPPRELDPLHPLIDPELPAKISALHSSLPAIEGLAPLLHPTLERLRALREVHQDSASADTRLTELEQHEVEIQKQLRTWRDSLLDLEKHTDELEEEWLENMQNVEKKVKELEGRIRAL